MEHNNDFLIKYRPIDWKPDAISTLNKIGNNLVKRYDDLEFEKTEFTEDYPVGRFAGTSKNKAFIKVKQGKNVCDIFWKFDLSSFTGYVTDEYGEPLKDMKDIEKVLNRCNIQKDIGDVNERIKDFKSFKDIS